MHFEISERKVLLLLFDVVFILSALYLLSLVFHYNYFVFDKKNFPSILLILTYVYAFGIIFEMYNLQVASSQLQILQSVIFTATASSLAYLFTPVLSPELPKQRLIIVIFYFTILVTLLLWRLFYVYFLASHRFSQNVVLICDQNQVEELVLGLENVDPHYKIIGFVNSDSIEDLGISYG